MSEPIRTRRPIHTTMTEVEPGLHRAIDTYRIAEGEYVVEVAEGRGVRPTQWETIRVRPFDLRT